MLRKSNAVRTALQPHQQRVVDRIQRDDQPGLVVAHGMGSGKTLSGIAAAEALGGTARVIVPASLQSNFSKEIAKHQDPNKRDAKYEIDSMQRIARTRSIAPADTQIIDEAHRLRDSGGAASQTVAQSKAKKRLLLTGTPFYNHPHDIAPLMNIAAGHNVLPQQRADFEREYVQNIASKPGLVARYLRGIKPGEVAGLKNTEHLRGLLQKWVDYHENTQEHFPERVDTTIEAPLSTKQRELYDHMMGTAPPWLRYKIRNGLPPSKQEAKNLNSFLTGVRQVSNSTGGFDKRAPEQAATDSAKIQEAVNRLQAGIKANPRHRALVYSNFLEAGINPYSAELKRRGIAHGHFTGQQSKSERDSQVVAYNEGRLPVMLLSSAGGEGLDLKGTRQIQILEPHFNREKLEQVIARGVRFKSHAHLSPEERRVAVEHYVSTLPRSKAKKLFGMKQDKGVDEYLRQMSSDKDRLNEQMRTLLRQKAASVLQPVVASLVRRMAEQEHGA
jgi:SNF2 family DNA or RNA helicase